MSKDNHRQITISEMAPHVHTFLPKENKAEKIAKWLKNWIVLSLETGKICPFDLLPSKAELAYHIGVSQGTIQNVFRILEDDNFVESKQKIGTYIKSPNNTKKIEKLTSKREIAIENIKKYFVSEGYIAGDSVPSSRKMAQLLGISSTTIRCAFTYLVNKNVLKKTKGSYRLLQTITSASDIMTETLVNKVAENIKRIIKSEFKEGGRLPSNKDLSLRLHVSVKTIHDAIKQLVKEGVLYTRRGRYGTIVVDKANSSEEELYNYERAEQKIKQYILSNSSIGDKLPSIKEFAKMYKVSEKTIKHSLDDLAEDGFVMFSRGKYGGTFVTDIPQVSSEAYKWLAINSKYLSENDN